MGGCVDEEFDGPDDAYYAGQVTGNLRNMTVATWLLGPALNQVVFDEVALGLVLEIDGEEIYWSNAGADVVSVETSSPGLVGGHGCPLAGVSSSISDRGRMGSPHGRSRK